MIVVIGSPVGRRGVDGLVAGGLAAAVARSAAAAGASVQLVGKVGEGSDGDQVLLSLAATHVGHIAMLRDASPVAVDRNPVAEADDASLSAGVAEAVLDGDDGTRNPTSRSHETGVGALDAGDLSLALRYLPDYRVVVLATDLDEAARASVVEAARWGGAQLVAVIPSGASPLAELPDDATVLEAPDDDEDDAFAAMVGRYAAALDGGAVPADAFATATSGSGSRWSAVEA